VNIDDAERRFDRSARPRLDAILPPTRPSVNGVILEFE
jgi:hypothetical protein